MLPKDNTDNTDRMSSVSNSSRFSLKSQQVIADQDVTIAKQGGTILAMRAAMIKAGLDPDVLLLPAAADVHGNPTDGYVSPPPTTDQNVCTSMEIDNALISKKKTPLRVSSGLRLE